MFPEPAGSGVMRRFGNVSSYNCILPLKNWRNYIMEWKENPIDKCAQSLTSLNISLLITFEDKMIHALKYLILIKTNLQLSSKDSRN